MLLVLGTTAFSIYKPDAFLNRPCILSRVGEVSYSMYLLHIPLGVYLLSGLQADLGMEAIPYKFIYYAVLTVL